MIELATGTGSIAVRPAAAVDLDVVICRSGGRLALEADPLVLASGRSPSATEPKVRGSNPLGRAAGSRLCISGSTLAFTGRPRYGPGPRAVAASGPDADSADASQPAHPKSATSTIERRQQFDLGMSLDLVDISPPKDARQIMTWIARPRPAPSALGARRTRQILDLRPSLSSLAPPELRGRTTRSIAAFDTP